MSFAPATDLGGTHPGAGLSWRCGVIASLGAILLLIDRVATATSTTTGLLGRTFTHFDVGHAVIVVAVSVAALGTWLPNSPTRVEMSLRSWFGPGAVIIYTLWTAAVVAAIAALHPDTGGRQVLTTLVLFRPLHAGGIIAGLGIGPLVLELVMIAAIAPFLARAVSGARPQALGRLRQDANNTAVLLSCSASPSGWSSSPPVGEAPLVCSAHFPLISICSASACGSRRG